jgi:hypothetical protein
VGIDQLTAFNPDAVDKVQTPNLQAIADAGVKFNNFWTMPECSPSRVCFFTGRYPMRTGVDAAYTPADLPAAQASPYEATAPRVLRTAGYRSALFGKFHLAGPENNPDGLGAPHGLGFDYYNGMVQGAPAPNDPTIGGQWTGDVPGQPLRYPSGFPVGSQRGVCWFQDAKGRIYIDDNRGNGYTGQDCVTRGGIPALNDAGSFATRARDAHHRPDFSAFNGYYVMPNVINEGHRIKQSTEHSYATTRQTDDGIDWINQQMKKGGAKRHFMCTMSYNAIHTPYQQPPLDLYPPGFSWPAFIAEDVTTEAGQKIAGDLMLAAMDKEIGRLLVETGIARKGPGGKLIYHPEDTNTMIVIAGDNGTYLPSVKFPYDPLRSKATPYQTGVSTPLIVAGPLVKKPGRSVDAITNCVDLFQLFGEIAGVNVRSLVPSSHRLDCAPMLAYLTNPHQSSLRQYNFSQAGSGVKSPTTRAQMGPCVIPFGPQAVATDKIIYSADLCTQEGGTWYGPGADVEYPDCCAVRTANIYPSLTIIPDSVSAIRNERYKLVKSARPACDQDLGEYEFYDLKPTLLNPKGLDVAPANLLVAGDPSSLTPVQFANYNELQQALAAQLSSEPVCTGDGNLDKRVNGEDIDGVRKNWGQPSRFDFNNDGTTDQQDLLIVLQNLGSHCI